MKWIIFGAFIFIVGSIAVWVLMLWGSKTPFKHRRLDKEKLRRLLRTLLYRGFDSGHLIVSVSKTEKFVQFAKYVVGPNKVGLRMDFPDAPWSREYFDDVREFLSSTGQTFEIEETGRDDTRRFLTIDFSQDVDRAGTIASTILRDVFGADTERDCYAQLDGVRPRGDDRIGFP